MAVRNISREQERWQRRQANRERSEAQAGRFARGAQASARQQEIQAERERQRADELLAEREALRRMRESGFAPTFVGVDPARGLDEYGYTLTFSNGQTETSPSVLTPNAEQQRQLQIAAEREFQATAESLRRHPWWGDITPPQSQPAMLAEIAVREFMQFSGYGPMDAQMEAFQERLVEVFTAAINRHAAQNFEPIVQIPNITVPWSQPQDPSSWGAVQEAVPPGEPDTRVPPYHDDAVMAAGMAVAASENLVPGDRLTIGNIPTVTEPPVPPGQIRFVPQPLQPTQLFYEMWRQFNSEAGAVLGVPPQLGAPPEPTPPPSKYQGIERVIVEREPGKDENAKP